MSHVHFLRSRKLADALRRGLGSPRKASRALRLVIASSLILTPLAPATAREAPANGTVTITSPGEGAAVTGKVSLAATAPSDTTSIAFDWSKDGGSHWVLIAVDPTGTDGWGSVWNTQHFSGSAQLRAQATTSLGEESDVITVRVDNDLPKITVTASHHAFSPNGDGRFDKLTLKVAATERVRLKVMLKNPRGLTIRTWDLKRSLRSHSLRWAGRARGARVSDGRFRLKVVATDDVGLKDHASRIAVVDTKAPRVYLKWARPEPLRDGSRVNVKYHLRDRSKQLKLRFRIQGDFANRIIHAGLRPRGIRELSLKFTRRGGHLLRTGLYHLHAVSTDRAGNVGHSQASRPWRVLRAGRAHVYRRLENVGRRVALTFDDCYDTAAWRSILQILHSNHVRATFFCNTIYVAAHPSLARRTVRWGNAIGAHTPRHDLQTSLSAAGTERQLRSDIATWWRVAKATPAPFFRPPYGAYDGATLSGAGAAASTRFVLWDIDTQDWMLPGSSVIAARALQAKKGSIVLMHAISQTAGALPSILRGLTSRNLSPVTIPGLFKIAMSRHSLGQSQIARDSWKGLYSAQRVGMFTGVFPGARL